jgi:hypothetical protein
MADEKTRINSKSYGTLSLKQQLRVNTCLKIMLLDCVSGGRGIAFQLAPPSNLAKNIILKPIEMPFFGNYISLLL